MYNSPASQDRVDDSWDVSGGMLLRPETRSVVDALVGEQRAMLRDSASASISVRAGGRLSQENDALLGHPEKPFEAGYPDDFEASPHGLAFYGDVHISPSVESGGKGAIILFLQCVLRTRWRRAWLLARAR